MTARRISLVCLLIVLFAAIAVGLVMRHAWQDWQSWIQARGIEQLDWQGVDLGLSELGLEVVTVRQQLGQTERNARLEQVTVRWDWRWPLPQLTEIQVERLELSIEEGADPATDDGGMLAMPDLPQEPPLWLPQRLSIDRFEAELPCAAGRCTLAGAIQLTRPEDLLPLELDLTLTRDSHHLDLSAELSGNTGDQLHLDASISLDDQAYLTLTSTYKTADENTPVSWSGELDMPSPPTADWMMEWLSQWQPLPDLPLPAASSNANLAGHWRLEAGSADRLLRPETGEIALQFHLPQPWPMPGVGAVQGSLDMELYAHQNQWAPRTLTGDLTLSEPADWADSLPGPLQPERISIALKPPAEGSEAQPGQLPLHLSAEVAGPTDLMLESALVVATRPPWRAELGSSRLKASHPDLILGGWELDSLAADLNFTGRIDGSRFTAKLLEGSRVRAAAISIGEEEGGLSAGASSLNLAGQSLEVAFNVETPSVSAASLTGPVRIELDPLRHPILKPQGWEGWGQVAVNLSRLATTLRATSASGFGADLSLSKPFGGSLVLDASTSMAASLADQYLSALLTFWPQTLDLEEGQVMAEASVRQGPGDAGIISGHLELTDLGGTWSRMAITGVTGKLNGKLEAGEFSVASDELVINEINPGVPVGPVDLALSYQGQSDQPLAGYLDVDRAVADFLGGQVQVLPDQLEFASMPVEVPLELERLRLSRLIALYPTEGLSGTGTISGRIPLLISGEGVRVEDGHVRALDPGGVLKLPAERIPGLGQGNEAVAMIGEALKNFHYSVLNSTVDYDRDGTLRLDLRIEGRNPEVRDGYPVVLNVDLEEDLPALLTSLQLSGRVNEAVTERVRERVRERRSTDN